MVGKRGWIRIVESTFAIMLIASVLIILYSKQGAGERVDFENSVYNLEAKILGDIANNETLRADVLNGETKRIKVFAEKVIPKDFDYSLKVCDINTPCKLSEDEVKRSLSKEVYVRERIVAANFTSYKPKIVKIFIWSK